MMYPYVKLCKDQTEVSFSQIIQENEIDTIEVHFERPGKKGFDEASIKLPNYEWIYNNGYSDEEIEYFTKFTEKNADLFYRYAQEGGIQSA